METVKELIKRLQMHPENAEVILVNRKKNHTHKIEEMKFVEAPIKKKDGSFKGTKKVLILYTEQTI